MAMAMAMARESLVLPGNEVARAARVRSTGIGWLSVPPFLLAAMSAIGIVAHHAEHGFERGIGPAIFAVALCIGLPAALGIVCLSRAHRLRRIAGVAADPRFIWHLGGRTLTPTIDGTPRLDLMFKIGPRTRRRLARTARAIAARVAADEKAAATARARASITEPIALPANRVERAAEVMAKRLRWTAGVVVGLVVVFVGVAAVAALTDRPIATGAGEVAELALLMFAAPLGLALAVRAKARRLAAIGRTAMAEPALVWVVQDYRVLGFDEVGTPRRELGFRITPQLRGELIEVASATLR